ncbi:MAG: hypothetical protein CMJ46_14280 [Planctomyces sp.]|nr:hypothetical protein [Planctomyces sp.]
MTYSRRKTLRRFEKSRDAHELTFSCQGRRPLLVNDDWNRLLADHINQATSRHGYDLIAYVFMPEHVHLLVLPHEKCRSISVLLSGIKRPFSYRVKQILAESHDPLLDELTIQQRPGINAFRFWLEGAGYDRNLTNTQTFEAAIEYIHNNPARRGLCERAIDWRWSSARHFLEPGSQSDDSLPRLDSIPVQWKSTGNGFY